MGLFANILQWFRGKAKQQENSVPDTEAEDPETGETSAETSSSEVLPAVFYEKNLFERARTQWQFGDWESLAQIKRESLYHHPRRASLALLAAAGHQQRGDMEATREFTRLAREWGASKKTVSQVLIAGVYNTLGKASALCGQQQRALGHFEESLRTAGDGGDMQLLTQARAGQQLGSLDWAQRENIDKAHQSFQKTSENQKESAGVEDYRQNPSFSAKAYGYLCSLEDKSKPPKFILIDSKSLPRSGLHYLKNTLARLLPGHFSFCEWYQEPGCCKRMPCEITAYAESAQREEKLKVRLVKSHDFDLNDPVYPVTNNIQRLILVRDPVFILTSWFELHQMERHADILKEHAIDMRKIYLLHESEVSGKALRLIDEHYRPIGEKELRNWLAERSKYIIGFLRRWVVPSVENPEFGWQVVPYEEIDTYVSGLVQSLERRVSHQSQWEIRHFINNKHDSFSPRQDAFRLKSLKVTEEVQSNAGLFRESVETIKDSQGWHSLSFILR